MYTLKITFKNGIECSSNKEYLKINNKMSLPQRSLSQRSLPQRTHNDLWLKLPLRANRCITELMYHLPNLLVVSSTYSTHFSDSVWGSLSVRPILRHCIRIGLNKQITVLRLIGFSNKNELNVCSWLRNVPCSKTLFLVLRLRLCLEVKVQYPNAKSPKLLVLSITL